MCSCDLTVRHKYRGYCPECRAHIAREAAKIDAERERQERLAAEEYEATQEAE